MGISVLGPLTVDGANGRIRHQDRVVLAALSVNPGGTVSAERLADALWGAEPPDTWAKVVQGCVVRLRKTLGAEAIETTPHGYRLTLPGDDVDACRFERLVGRGRELLTLSEPERAAYVLGEALALWRGPALTELDGWAFGRAEVARLKELRNDAEELAVDAALRAGRSREILVQAQRLVTEAPLRERRWALLALAQYQAGQQAHALRTIRHVAAVLSRELGLDPGPELVALEQAILRQDPALAVEAALPEPSPTCPYRGLVPYQVVDADTFFGREGEIAECLRRLHNQGVLVVVGPSGSGKSSLVRAGVAAALERQGRRVFVVTPGRHPLDALSVLPGSGPTPVLVVDQCEEVFSLCESAEARTEFLRRLVEHATCALLVVALRADRIGETSGHLSFASLVERGLFLLGPMEEDHLRTCIEAPARQAGLLLEPGLEDLLVREVEGESGGLPLLSHALRETWAHREGRTLTVAGYQASGGIRGAVARSAEEIYEQVPEEQRPIVRELLLRLVAPSVDGEPVRNRMPRRLVVDDDQHSEVIEKLVAARLVTSDDGVLELAHESLVRAWPRFKQWLADDTEGQRIVRHLSMAADTWDSMGRPESELYRGVRLAQAIDWRESARPDLTSVEQEFLEASRIQVDAELREARRRVDAERHARQRTRRLAAALAAALALALVAAGGAISYQQAAADRATEAAEASTEADANRLAALSRSVGSIDLSLLLAAEAGRTADTPATRDGLLNTLLTHRRATQVLQLSNQPVDVVLTDRGRTLFIAMQTEVLTWPMGSDEAPTEVFRWGHKFDYLAGSATRDLVAAWSWKDDETPRIGVFDASGTSLLVLEGFDRIGGEPQGLAFAPDGGSLFVTALSTDAGASRTHVHEFDLETGRRLGRHRLRTVTRTDQNTWSAIADDAGSAVSWTFGSQEPAVTLDLQSGERSRVEVVDRPGVLSVGFIPLPGGGLAQLWDDGPVTVYDRGGVQQQVLRVHTSGVEDIAVSPSGDWAATADRFGSLVVWDIYRQTGEWTPRETQLGHVGRVAGLAVDPAGERLVSVSHDGAAVTWDMTDGSGFASSTGGLGNSWISNRPAEVTQGELVVAPTRPAPDEIDAWSEQRAVSATFLDPRTGRIVDQVYVGENMGSIFGSSVSVSHDRSMVAVTYGFGTVVLDARTREVVARLVLPEIELFGERKPEPVWCTAWTPDDSRLLLCADGHEFDPDDGNLVVVDTATWEVAPERVPVGGAVQTLELSPDRTLIAAGMTIPAVDESPPGAVKLLDAQTLDVVREMTLGPDAFPYDLSFSPQGDKVAVGVHTGLVYVFDVAGGQMVHPPARAHQDFVQQVEWLPDGRTVVSTGGEGMVTLYDVERGLVRATLPASPRERKAFTYLLRVNEDAVTAVAGEHRGVVYPLDPGEWLRKACAVVGRDLSEDEWSAYLPERPYRRTCGERS